MMEDIVTLISNVGFPIAACVALFWQNNKMSEALNRNTEAINRLAARLDMDDDLRGGAHG